MERVIPPIEALRTTRLVLRPPRPADAPIIARNCAPLEVVMNTLTMPHPYALADAEAFLGRVKAGWESGEACTWAMTRAVADGAEELLGCIGLRCDWTHRHAEAGYVLGMAAWGQGFATEALRAVVEYSFTRTPLERLHASYFARNPASGRVLEKCGFRPEGVRPRMYLRFGEWLDQSLMGLLREEWALARAQPE